jgi:hypothetical protein
MSEIRGEVSSDEAFWQTVAIEFPEEVIPVDDETGHTKPASEALTSSLARVVLAVEYARIEDEGPDPFPSTRPRPPRQPKPTTPKPSGPKDPKKPTVR